MQGQLCVDVHGLTQAHPAAVVLAGTWKVQGCYVFSGEGQDMQASIPALTSDGLPPSRFALLACSAAEMCGANCRSSAADGMLANMGNITWPGNQVELDHGHNMQPVGNHLCPGAGQQVHLHLNSH